MRTFAQLTGQLWKIRIFQIVGITGGVAVVGYFIVLLSGNPLGLPEGPILRNAIYPIFFFAWFIWYATAIRCPKCHKSLVWHHMTQGSAWRFDRRLSEACTCPSCGFDPIKTSLNEK